MGGASIRSTVLVLLQRDNTQENAIGHSYESMIRIRIGKAVLKCIYLFNKTQKIEFCIYFFNKTRKIEFWYFTHNHKCKYYFSQILVYVWSSYSSVSHTVLNVITLVSSATAICACSRPLLEPN